MSDKKFSVEDLPWMKLGVQVTEAQTSVDAAKLGGLDFTVSKRDLQFATPTASGEKLWSDAASRKAIVADDTDEFFDVVSADYGILQYTEALDFLDQVNPLFVAAGTLKGRRQGFMVVQIPEHMSIPMQVDDPHDLYAVVRTSHDRSRGVEVNLMPLRGRCMNQLPIRSFSRTAIQRWSVTHIGDVKGKLMEATNLVERANEYKQEFAETTTRLAGIPIDTHAAQTVLNHVVRDTKKKGEVVDAITALWHNDETVGFHGTGWGLVNAVSSYYEHNRKGGTAQSQLLGVLEGPTRKAIDATTTLVLSRYGA